MVEDKERMEKDESERSKSYHQLMGANDLYISEHVPICDQLNG